jgi:hypothetical protein
MAGIDRTVFTDALKEYYLGPLRDQVNRATALLDILDTRSNVQVEGKYFVVPLISRKHKGVVSRSGASKTANKLPTASAQTYKRSIWYMKYHYARIEIDGPVMRSTKTDRGAFARALDAEIRGVGIALPQDLNRQCWGDGLNKLAQVAADVSGATTVTCDSTRFLEVGQPISFLDNTTGAVVDTETVDSITNATTFETSANVTGVVAADDGIYAESDSTATSWRNGMTGLQAIVSDANVTDMAVNVGSLDRTAADNDFWKANKLGNSGTNRPLSTGLMQQAVLASQNNKFGGVAPTHAWMDADVWATYGSLIHADRRFNSKEMTLDGGWVYLEFSGVKCLWDKDAPPNQIYFINKDHLFFLQQSDLQYMDEDGNMLNRVTDYDSYEATLLCDKEMASDLCAAHTLLDDIEVNLG